MKKRVFISFDYDNDLRYKDLLVSQSKIEDSPFEIINWSLKEEQPEDEWEENALERIKRSEIVIVLVGELTYKASGVLKEVKMARDNNIKIVQVKINDSNPKRVVDGGVLYNWTWVNLKNLLS